MTAYEQGQELRRSGELLRARQRLLVCAQPTCHALVTRDCTKWVTEIEEIIPSILISARSSAGKDIAEHELVVDGQTLDPAASNGPILLDPGRHTIRDAAPGFVPYEDTIVMQAGDRNRVLRITLRSLTEPTPSTTPGPNSGAAGAADKPPSPPGEARSGGSALPYIFAGVSVAAFGAGTYLYFAGLSDAHTMQRSPAEGGCKPNCTEDNVSIARSKIVAGNVGLGIGLVAAGAAVWTFLASRPSSPPQRSATTTSPSHVAGAAEHIGFGVAPTAGGGVAGVWGSF